MNETLIKFAGGIALFFGEVLAIYSEMIAARTAKEHGLTPLLALWMLLLIVIAGGLLLAGYYFGYLSNKNIWVVTVISLGSILIAEPLLILFFFKEMPTTGAWVGLACAVIGMLAALLF